LFSVGNSSLKITKLAQKFGATFSRQGLCINFDQKNGLGYVLSDFFTDPSCHPGGRAQARSGSNSWKNLCNGGLGAVGAQACVCDNELEPGLPDGLF
jgi:hypothetical protein